MRPPAQMVSIRSRLPLPSVSLSAPHSMSLVTGYAPLIPGLSLPDEDDRHVLAAAIKCSAQIIVTKNHKDFPSETLEEYGVETLGADDFLANTYDLFPKSGMPKLAALARADIEYL
ncbi:MAG: PIN domain-containing protein [Alphaproteobacteria bacterium]|nr:PIN domain-containing protein [Alphaproteobacteria bacterium]